MSTSINFFPKKSGNSLNLLRSQTEFLRVLCRSGADFYMFHIIDAIAVMIFIVDYLLRWGTADYKLNKKGIVPFIKYPFTFMAIIDLVSIYHQ